MNKTTFWGRRTGRELKAGVRETVVKVRVSPGQYSKEQLQSYITAHIRRLPESYQEKKKKKKEEEEEIRKSSNNGSLILLPALRTNSPKLAAHHTITPA